MIFLPSPERWDADDTRYVRNAIVIGCAVALFTEVVRGTVDVVKKQWEKKLDKSETKE